VTRVSCWKVWGLLFLKDKALSLFCISLRYSIANYVESRNIVNHTSRDGTSLIGRLRKFTTTTFDLCNDTTSRRAKFLLQKLFLHRGSQVLGHTQGFYCSVDGGNARWLCSVGAVGGDSFLDSNVVRILREKVWHCTWVFLL